MKLRPLAFLVFVLVVVASLRAAESAVAKSWFFTTTDRLTVDLKLAPNVAPDWAGATLTLKRVGAGANEAAARLALDPKNVSTTPDTPVQRLVFEGLHVTPWTPTAPALYQATLEFSDRTGRRETVTRRVGFRSFATREGRLYLNDRPIFLRGLAINPPGRGIPEEIERSRGFAEDYIRYVKSIHVNIIRIPDDPTWYDVCDELGMMVFGGNYGGAVNGKGPTSAPEAAVTWYREQKFYPFTHHPSLMIYALTNEVAYLGAQGEKWDAFLGEIHRRLQPWDPTRLYIANAGYGAGRVGEINDLHRYWGWYYQTPFTFLHLRDYDPIVGPGKIQPLTFTECVGNYNGPDGRTNLSPNHKNPLSQQNWLGHASAEEEGQLGFEHQSFTIKQATELFRRLRPINPELSGVFPFTIMFNNWHTISSFAEMGAKPAALQLRASYQPVLLSWELYTPQVYAGSDLKPIAHIVNDDDLGADLRGATLTYELRDSAQRAVFSAKLTAPDVAYYGTARLPLTVKIPATLATGTYKLYGAITHGGRVVSENSTELLIAAPGFARAGRATKAAVRLFDPSGATQRALAKIGVTSTPLAFANDATAALATDAPIVVGEDAAEKLSAPQARALADFAKRGGRMLVLRQSHTAAAAVAPLVPAALRMPTTDIDDPSYPPPPRPARNSFNIDPERPDHPVFAGIDRRKLHVWSDYTGWDEQKKDFPHIYPVTDGFVITNKDEVRNTAVLADYGPGLEGIALAEFFTGTGSVMFSAFDLVARAGLDPVADRLLTNLASYLTQADGHERYPLIDAPIVWGHYETEKGVLTGINSGLMLNSRPALTGSYRDGIEITVTKDGHEFAGGPGGWNSRPGIQYVAYGRRPFGPYVHRGWSGVPTHEAAIALAKGKPREPDAIYDEAEVVTGNGGEGEGHFWCRIPPGKTAATHRVFNPADEPLAVHVRVNGRDVSATIAPGATAVVNVPLAADATTIECQIRGDRRLVLLETSFE